MLEERGQALELGLDLLAIEVVLADQLHDRLVDQIGVKEVRIRVRALSCEREGEPREDLCFVRPFVLEDRGVVLPEAADRVDHEGQLVGRLPRADGAGRITSAWRVVSFT